MSWPGFSAIANAWWLFLLVPLVVFYFLKLRRQRVEISSLSLWQSVLDDQRVNSPFQKFKRNLLLWLQIALLTLLVLAAMQPYFTGETGQARYMPVLIDCSASMAATDEQTNRSRLSLAKAQARELIENLLPDQRLSLIAVHSSAQRLTEFTSNRRVLLDALDQLVVRDVPSRLENALRMTQALARTVPIETVIVYSDGNFPERVSFQLPFKLNYQQINSAGPNAGITAFNARQKSPPEWEAFLRVEASAATSGNVELLQDGRKVGEEAFVLDEGQSQRLSFTIESDVASQLEAKLTVDSDSTDSLQTDNVAYIDLPTSRNLRVYVDPRLSNYRHAMRDAVNVELYPQSAGAASRTIPYDLVISPDAVDEKIDATVHFFVGLVPADAKDLIETRPGAATFETEDLSSALLQHMNLREIQIAEDVLYKGGTKVGDLEELGYSVLAEGQNGPLILERRIGANLTYHLLFHSDRSTLPFRVAFPILVTNALQIARHEARISEARGAQTKVLPARILAADSRYTIVSPSGESVDAVTDKNGLLNGVEATEAGRYRILDGGSETATVAVSLLDSMETTLKTVDTIQFDELAVTAADELLDVDRPLWTTLAAIAFVILLAEWWFFQRPLTD